MKTVKQADATTIRKVRWATTAAAIAAPLSYPAAVWFMSITTLPPALEHSEAIRLSLETLIATMLTALPTWAAGYYVSAEEGEVGQ